MITEKLNGEDVSLYVWPEPNFPFMPYLIHNKCRIFIIENLQHNYKWLNDCKNYFKETDYFFVIVGCYMNDYNTIVDKKMFDHLHLNKKNFIIMFNDSRDECLFRKYGFDGELINHNTWLDENLFTVNRTLFNKIYDAVLVSRIIECKRLYLASKIERLALITGGPVASTDIIPPHINKNFDKRLDSKELIEVFHKSKCGLCLSAEEGASYSSSEYLLCGLPVVSTASEGGRNIWYNNFNSLIVQDNVDSVFDGVSKITTKGIDSLKIRNDHVDMSKMFRNKFIKKLEEILKICNVHDIDPEKYFHDHFVHKMVSYFFRINQVIQLFENNGFVDHGFNLIYNDKYKG